MNSKRLWTLLSLPLILSGITLIFALQYSAVQEHWVFYLLSLIFFTLSSVLANLLGFKTTGASNKSLFGSVALAMMTFKMMGAALFAIVYFKLYPESSRWFILPFFLMYLYFAIYETFALVHIGRFPYHKQ